ncbi:Lrp/AsnC ligand binding domain-containing protein [uncultured Porphyromonas sp.]|jgi:transcriptional regulator, asnC family protein|uniref:Lrp/AsnC family transcriptional regulator n=1 Tax=uncultured Porphyromonas sp. TaxID=159274 RepID=UPI002630246D|nr:Lrp/AsnC ligand binding domain-containing protein [uncultured Porphyromonas sp.]
MKIDKLDRRILAIISDNARIPFRDVAERCGVSRAAIHQHVQRMVERGVITGSGYRVNPKDLGYTTCTYIGVRLERAAMYREVLPQIEAIPEVVECHYTTGPYSMLIKLYAVDNSHLMHILSNRIQSIAGVSSTETLISLAEGFVRNMPIPEEDTSDSYTSYNAE